MSLRGYLGWEADCARRDREEAFRAEQMAALQRDNEALAAALPVTKPTGLDDWLPDPHGMSLKEKLLLAESLQCQSTQEEGALLAAQGFEPFFGTDRTGPGLSWRPEPKRGLRERLRDVWAAARDAWKWGR